MNALARLSLTGGMPKKVDRDRRVVIRPQCRDLKGAILVGRKGIPDGVGREVAVFRLELFQ